MTTTDLDVADHHAAGALADELPYWGWLPDERTCLTRRGELVTFARLSPTVVDGHTPEQLDAVLGRCQCAGTRSVPDLSASPWGASGCATRAASVQASVRRRPGGCLPAPRSTRHPTGHPKPHTVVVPPSQYSENSETR